MTPLGAVCLILAALLAVVGIIWSAIRAADRDAARHSAMEEDEGPPKLTPQMRRAIREAQERQQRRTRVVDWPRRSER